jgi:ferredoxin
LPDRYWDLYNHRMPGMQISVSPDCTLCGDCIVACYGGARVITLVETRAEINIRCIPACPQGAIKLEIDSQEGDMIEALLDRIATRVDITGMR